MKFSIRLLVLEVFAVILLITMCAIGFLVWRLSQGPLDLQMLKPRVEAALTKARDGLPVTLESLALEWSTDKKRVEATFTGIKAYDEDHLVQARARTGAIWFDTSELLEGNISVLKLRLYEGKLALLRDPKGVWSTLSEGQERNIHSNQNDDEEISIDSNNFFDIWKDQIDIYRGKIASQNFQSVEIEKFEIQIIDTITDMSWTAVDAEGYVETNADGVQVDVSSDLTGEHAPEAFQFRLFSDAKIENVSVELGLVGATPERLAAVLAQDDFPIRYEGVIDLNIGAIGRVSSGLDSAHFSAAGEKGKLIYGDDEYVIDSLNFETLFDFETRRADLTQLYLRTDIIDGEISGWVDLKEYFQGIDEPVYPFVVRLENTTLNLQPVFENEWDIDSLDLSGGLDPSKLSLNFDQIIGRIPNLSATGSGRVYLLPNLELGDDEQDKQKSFKERLGAEFEAVGEGNVTPQQVLAYWPVKLGSGGRSWAKNHIHAGRATKLNLKLDFPPGANSQGLLPDEHLTLDFQIENASVSFLNQMPPISEASGLGRLRGNSLTVELEQGKLANWVIDEGRVELPAFHPEGAISTITAVGRGDLGNLMAVLENTDLKVCTEYGLTCDRIAGFGGLEIKVTRPMLKIPDPDKIEFTVNGGFVDATIPDLIAGFGLAKTDLNIELDRQSMTLKGAGRFGAAPTEFEWRQVFDTDSGTELTARAIVTPDLFNALGLTARSIMQGEADLDLRARGDGREFESIDMHFDFTGAALNLSEVGWVKPLYVPAQGDIRFGKSSDGVSLITGDVTAEGLELAGEIILTDTQGLQRATIERIYSKDRIDLKGDLTRQVNGDVRINVSGPFLDASPWLDGFFEMNEGGGPGVNVSTQVAVDKLKLREDAELLNSKLVVEMAPQSLESALLNGTISRGKGLEAILERDGEDLAFQLASDDAGFVTRTWLKNNYLIGGQLNMTGILGKELGTAELNMKDVRLKGAPLFAKLFALASLRGLADVLNGDGVMFTNVDVPIRFREGRIEMPGTRASGPAMGLTTRGWLHLESGELSLDGVIVPSFGVNSALGGIPIIGDLFVSRQGEGVFALTYSVRGALERAQISINPLSAVTPGFLRRIMENPNKPPQEN